MAKTALSPKQRFELFNKVYRQGIPVTKACKEYGISRKTFYKWAKKYDPKKSRNYNLNSLRDREKKVTKLQTQTPKSIEKEIKAIASNKPNLSKYKIADKIKKRFGNEAVGIHGVYNVLRSTSC